MVQRLVDVGGRVEAGTVIARLDATDLKLQVDAAIANLDAAKTKRDLAADELVRVQALAQKGFATKSLLDKATADADGSTSAYNAALAARDQALNQQAYAELKADASGIVTEIRADTGQVVAAGTPVAVIARDGEKEVAFSVPEQTVGQIAIGQKVRVSTWADAGVTLDGTIREIAGAADALSRTFAVRVSLPSDAAAEKVRLGMTATVAIDLPRTVPHQGSDISVPLSALAEKDGGTIVWVVDRAAGTVASRKVEVGRTTGDGVRLVSGVIDGEAVVVAGTQFMREGLKVRISGGNQFASRLTP
jgi:RND family efflux transporter MFP subunit